MRAIFHSFLFLITLIKELMPEELHGLVEKRCRWTDSSSPVSCTVATLLECHPHALLVLPYTWPVSPPWMFAALIAKGKNFHGPASLFQTLLQYARPSLPGSKRRRWGAHPWTQTGPALVRLLSLSQYLTPGQSLLTCFIDLLLYCQAITSLKS